ncbi:MAG: HAMP domain-containing sensor histidine kinase, partial [Candidatus Eiseniibacteriota bacterium]
LITAFFLIRWLTREIEYADLKTSFVSNVSHELKTPLALIRLYAETLELDRCGDAEQRRSCLQTISRESDRLTRLIDNVLDLSRIESGAMRYRLERTDITTVVDETLDAYRYHLDEQGFRVELDLVERPLVARVDAGALTQALVNLLDNAVKYSREVKEITVACRREGACALVSVRDRGEGIDREELPRIFETFYRGSGNGDAPAPGFGLGLALVHHIAAAHGGRVRVESHVGEGSTFTLELPLADGAALYRR